jgi:hypothetical protein
MLREDYQKQMDAVADRFYKMVNLTVLVCFTFTWAIFSTDKNLMQNPLEIGGCVVLGGFIVLAIIRSGADQKIRLIRAAYERDHNDQFESASILPLTGLFS